MKHLLILVLFMLAGVTVMAQNELKNITLGKSQMAGGTESSGITTTLTYTFISNEAVKMLHIQFKEKPLMLDAKDTIVIFFITHSPYGGSLGGPPVHGVYEDKTSFSAYYRNGSYRVSVNTELEFKRAATYRYKKKKYIAKRKTEIDFDNYNYAP
ncbi:MAG: hypothetical protein GQ574_03660 [Crocinitomix sp.]|nr:hypothetical protein [Crocinitomix sp.]